MNMNYKLGDIVFLKTDAEQKIRMVTGILQRPNHLLYYLTNETDETTHFEIEISKELNQIMKLMTND